MVKSKNFFLQRLGLFRILRVIRIRVVNRGTRADAVVIRVVRECFAVGVSPSSERAPVF